MRFWNDRNLEPKRNFKFRLFIPGGAGLGAGTEGLDEYIVKSSQRPNTTIEVAEHKYFNHTFKYPGSVTWEPIDLTIVDPISIGASEELRKIIRNSGYNLPDDPNDARKTISKSKATNAIGGIVRLEHTNSDDETVDSYKLQNPWVSNVEYSELSYDDDELSDITITVEYDFAVIEEGPGAGGGGGNAGGFGGDF